MRHNLQHPPYLESDRQADMLIKNGHYLIPDQSGFARGDIKVVGGTIQTIRSDISPEPGERVIEADGCIVTPGLADYHVHAFKHGHILSVDIEELAPRTGVTTFVDAGSVGGLHFQAFRKFVIDQTPLHLFAYLNISAIGQTTSGIRGLDVHDFDRPNLVNLPLAEEIIEKNRDVIIGIKMRAYTGLGNLEPLRETRKLADRFGLPIMVHTAPGPPEISDVLALLRDGDVITHPYHGGDDNLLGADGRIRPEYLDARDRGIKVDLGMDRFHCDLTVMKKAFDQGYYPDYISTDITLTNMNSVLFDLPTTVSKCVACGLSLEESLRRCTETVTDKIGKPHLDARIREGNTADLAVFKWEETGTDLVDFFGNRLTGQPRLSNVATILKGELLEHQQTDLTILNSVQTAVPWDNYT
ncbi:amidohydrolase family protein [Roseovarius aestuarii]|nr:amidohydrolase family protein [Roseovarius aestuarii]